MWSTKKTLLTIAWFTIFFVGNYLCGSFITKRNSIKYREKFDAANIHSRIENIVRNSREPVVTFENDNNEYQADFYRTEGALTHYDFRKNAEVGDSVVKETNADTLYLYKRDTVYKYIMLYLNSPYLHRKKV